MDLEKLKRSQFVTYLDTTPKGDAETYKILGYGITNYGLAFNPQITTEKFIIHDSATSVLDSYQKQGDVTQNCYKGDPCFEFINELRRKSLVGAEVQTTVLDIDKWDKGATEGSYKATKSDVIIAISNYMGENATIEYQIHYNGDPVEGTVTIDKETGVPTFTPNV